MFIRLTCTWSLPVPEVVLYLEAACSEAVLCVEVACSEAVLYLEASCF